MHTKAEWLAALAPLLGSETKTHVVDLLSFSCADKKLGSLHRQLLWFLVKHVEESLFKSISQDPPSKDAIRCAHVDLSELMWENDKLDYQLLKYIVSGMQASQGALCMHLAFDKANVGGLTLGNSVFSLPDDVAFVGAPQVSCPSYVGGVYWEGDGPTGHFFKIPAVWSILCR